MALIQSHCNVLREYTALFWQLSFESKLIETPPPRGGFFVGWFPNQEHGGRGPPLKNDPQNWVGFQTKSMSTDSLEEEDSH